MITNKQFHMQGQCDGNAQIPDTLTAGNNPPGEVPAGSCIIGVQDGLFRLASPNHYFWMDSVYLHAIPAAPGSKEIDDSDYDDVPKTGDFKCVCPCFPCHFAPESNFESK